MNNLQSIHISLDMDDFSIRTALDDVIHLFSAQAALKKLTLTSSVGLDVPDSLRGDRIRLGQVFSNLMSNAIHFSSSGEIILNSRLSDQQPDSGVKVALLFELKDPGTGISKQHLDNIFEHFSQVDESSTRPHGGTGLGLAISKELVTLMGGRIGVKSQLGEGSTFWFTAQFEVGGQQVAPKPLRQQVGDVQNTANDRQQPTNPGPWSEPDRRVLVVDDHKGVRLVLQRMLEELGFEVDLAANGQEAIDAVAAYNYAIILMDSQMPHMDGNEATRIIRLAEGDTQHTPIIALTANVLPAEQEKAFAAGVDYYLCKPVFLEDLEAALGSLLSSDQDKPTKLEEADMQAPGMSSVSVFNKSIVEDLSKIGEPGKPGLFSELANLMLAQMPVWLHEMEFSATQGDVDSIRRQAHSMLGLCRQIGADRMAYVCADLKSTDLNTKVSDMLCEIENLNKEFERVERELHDKHLI